MQHLNRKFPHAQLHHSCWRFQNTRIYHTMIIKPTWCSQTHPFLTESNHRTQKNWSLGYRKHPNKKAVSWSCNELRIKDKAQTSRQCSHWHGGHLLQTNNFCKDYSKNMVWHSGTLHQESKRHRHPSSQAGEWSACMTFQMALPAFQRPWERVLDNPLASQLATPCMGHLAVTENTTPLA